MGGAGSTDTRGRTAGSSGRRVLTILTWQKVSGATGKQTLPALTSSLHRHSPPLEGSSQPPEGFRGAGGRQRAVLRSARAASPPGGPGRAEASEDPTVATKDQPLAAKERAQGLGMAGEKTKTSAGRFDLEILAFSNS